MNSGKYLTPSSFWNTGTGVALRWLFFIPIGLIFYQVGATLSLAVILILDFIPSKWLIFIALSGGSFYLLAVLYLFIYAAKALLFILPKKGIGTVIFLVILILAVALEIAGVVMFPNDSNLHPALEIGVYAVSLIAFGGSIIYLKNEL